MRGSASGEPTSSVGTPILDPQGVACGGEYGGLKGVVTFDALASNCRQEKD